MKKPNQWQSIFWVMDLKSAPASNSDRDPPVRAAAAAAAADNSQEQWKMKKATPRGVAFFIFKQEQHTVLIETCANRFPLILACDETLWGGNWPKRNCPLPWRNQAQLRSLRFATTLNLSQRSLIFYGHPAGSGFKTADRAEDQGAGWRKSAAY